MNQQEKDFQILLKIYHDYIEENPINEILWCSKPRRETYILNACHNIKWKLFNTNIDKSSDYYINSNNYIQKLIESQRNSDILIWEQEIQKKYRNEAIQKEDKIFQEKIKSLNK